MLYKAIICEEALWSTYQSWPWRVQKQRPDQRVLLYTKV
jgi:hypothetical protein